jgi:hypothetical protein
VLQANQLPLLVQYAQALGPAFVAIVAACIAGYIAWKQWKTAQDRLRLDMHQKRFVVYDAAKRLVNMTMIHGQLTAEDLGNFYDGIKGAEFLFDGETKVFLNKIGTMAIKAMNARARLQRQPDHPNADKIIDEEQDIVQFLMDQGPRLDSVFTRYLDISTVGLQ